MEDWLKELEVNPIAGAMKRSRSAIRVLQRASSRDEHGVWAKGQKECSTGLRKSITEWKRVQQ